MPNAMPAKYFFVCWKNVFIRLFKTSAVLEKLVQIIYFYLKKNKRICWKLLKYIKRLSMRVNIMAPDRIHVLPKERIVRYVLCLAIDLLWLHIFAKLLVHIASKWVYICICWDPTVATKLLGKCLWEKLKIWQNIFSKYYF